MYTQTDIHHIGTHKDVQTKRALIRINECIQMELSDDVMAGIEVRSLSQICRS